MWKWINSFAKPEKAYYLCDVLQNWFAAVAIAALLIGIVWGLGFAPPDYQQGDSFRIIYIHVPSAILAMGAYVAMAIAALVGVVWQWRTAYMFMIAIAPVGAIMTFISLFTGSFWGKPMWGTWWIWDARLTSQLILLFLYLGVISLYTAFEDKQQAGKAAGVMAMVGVINIPIIHYSVEWWNTLHQGATITKIGKPSIALEMYWPLLICILGFAAFIGWVTIIRMKSEIILRDLHRPWVAERFGAVDLTKAAIGQEQTAQEPSAQEPSAQIKQGGEE